MAAYRTIFDPAYEAHCEARRYRKPQPEYIRLCDTFDIAQDAVIDQQLDCTAEDLAAQVRLSRIEVLEQRAPGLIEMLCDDSFVEGMMKTCGATILIPKRTNQVVVIHGNITTIDDATIEKLRTWFEKDVVIRDWDGDDIDEYQPTLALTELPPPYNQDHQDVSLDAALILANERRR